MNPSIIALGALVVLGASLVSSEELTNSQQVSKQGLNDEMTSITKSLDDLIGELGFIKREAIGRLSNLKANSGNPSTSDAERIRQTKVSRFVLSRVAELETESLAMRDELAKLFKLESKPVAGSLMTDSSLVKQEDSEFEEPSSTSTTKQASSSSTQQQPSSTTSAKTTTSAASSTTSDNNQDQDQEGAKIGFDVEALKKLGLELEAELEARQAQTGESLRGVHDQVIKLVDNMVQNYLGNVRRMVNRMTNFIDSRQPAKVDSSSPKARSDVEASGSFRSTRDKILGQIEDVARSMFSFRVRWAGLVTRQQSPLLDRIPPRGVELWRDFWDTMRQQVRRINQEFTRLSQDMSRLVTGAPITGPAGNSKLEARDDAKEAAVSAFYDRMSSILANEQVKLDKMSSKPSADASNLIDEHDDELTRRELSQNVALRQQIQQEISVFGSIFDIMRAFIQRLRESASTVVRDVMQPGIGNNNDAVTPGPQIKPHVDKLLEETIDSQRNINSQAKPVLLPLTRPALNPKN